MLFDILDTFGHILDALAKLPQWTSHRVGKVQPQIILDFSYNYEYGYKYKYKQK